jgi:hypothetical protein
MYSTLGFSIYENKYHVILLRVNHRREASNGAKGKWVWGNIQLRKTRRKQHTNIDG